MAVESWLDRFRTEDGAEQIRTALGEQEILERERRTVTLGEPQIFHKEFEEISNAVVIVPVSNTPYGSVNHLVFPLPSPFNDKNNEFLNLLNRFNTDLDSMEELGGREVPFAFIAGNGHIAWDGVDEKKEEESFDVTD